MPVGRRLATRQLTEEIPMAHTVFLFLRRWLPWILAAELLPACRPVSDPESSATAGRIRAAVANLEQAGDAASRPGGAQARAEMAAHFAEVEAAIASMPTGATAKSLR